MTFYYHVIVHDGDLEHRLSMRGDEVLLTRIDEVVEGEVEVCYETGDDVTLILDVHDTPAGLHMSLADYNEVTVTSRLHSYTTTDSSLETDDTGAFPSDSENDEV